MNNMTSLDFRLLMLNGARRAAIRSMARSVAAIQNPISKIQNMLILIVSLCIVFLPGCQVGQLVGGMAQTHEYQKLVDTPPRYTGLEGKTVAVLVQADMTTLYENPELTMNIAGGVSQRIARDVPSTKVLHAEHVINWQYRTPQWNLLPYGELCEQLNVDRIVFVDVLEFRLNPPGNRYLWEGVCSGRIGIIERQSLDPDAFMETFDVTARYPKEAGLSRESARQDVIQFGVLQEFITETTWLFHQHLKPKYPDKYRAELAPKGKKKK